MRGTYLTTGLLHPYVGRFCWVRARITRIPPLRTPPAHLSPPWVPPSAAASVAACPATGPSGPATLTEPTTATTAVPSPATLRPTTLTRTGRDLPLLDDLDNRR